MRSENDSQQQYDDLLNFAITFKPEFNEIYFEGMSIYNNFKNIFK